MLSSASVARGLRASSSRLPTKRYASHGAPQYNEPSGWLFGEKVRDFSSVILFEVRMIYLRNISPLRQDKSV